MRGSSKDDELSFSGFLHNIEDMPDIGTQSVNDLLIVTTIQDFSLFITRPSAVAGGNKKGKYFSRPELCLRAPVAGTENACHNQNHQPRKFRCWSMFYVCAC